MPNTIKPTTVPQVTEGPLAVVPEVDDILALADGDVTIDPLTTGLPAEILDDGEILAAKLVAAKQAYALSLMNFHTFGSDDAKVKKAAGDLVRRNSAVSDTSTDEPETPPVLYTPPI